jgi:hypothetical protein
MGVSRISVKEAAAVIVVLALAVVALRAWQTAQSGYQALTGPVPTRTQRELGSFDSGRFDVALLASRRVIPRTATFSIRVGQSPPIDSSVLEAVTGLFRYWLLPRHYNENTRAVDWIITFHHPAETLGVAIRKVVPLGLDTDAVEVAR